MKMLIEKQKALILLHQTLSVAQLVEQLTLNQWVPGSNPGGETLKSNTYTFDRVGVFLLSPKKAS